MELDKLNMSLTWNNLQHKINTFEFVPGKTPLSTPYHVAGAVVIYLITLGILRLWISGRGALKLKGLASIHNLTLSSFSLVSLVAVLYHIIPIWVNRGVHAISCDPDRDIYGRGPVVFWFYLFYLSKMYEFLDTVIQILRKKTPSFLHVYHHCITLVLCYVTIVEGNPMQWADISANLFVHIIMYYYYYLTEQGIRVWWKKYITTVQIIQFVWDIAWHVGWYMVVRKSPPNTCGGTMAGFFFSNFVIVSFLALFIHFYIQTYKKPASAKPKTN